MSLEAMTWAWQQPLPVGQKLLLLAVADHAGEGGVCWPSQAHLARKTGFSERQVRNNLNDLVKAGVLSVEIRGGDGSGRKSNVYTMTWQPANISGWATGNLEHGNRQPTSGSPPYIYKPSIEPSFIDRFELFWKAYPLKVGKVAAAKEWRKKLRDADALIADVANRVKNDRQWQPGSQFIPHARTYLSQERWTDAIQPIVNQPARVIKPTNDADWLKLASDHGIRTKGKGYNEIWNEFLKSNRRMK